MKAENTGPRLTLDNRRVNVIKSKLMVEAINPYGGNAQVVMLLEKGIKGNTHFPMMDLNNIEIANLLSKYLKTHQLDKPK